MDYLELLRKHDDQKHWEYPAGFNYDSAQNRFIQFKGQLFSALRIELRVETGSYIQDASFHSQIEIPINSTGAHLLMRFSNFGDMVSVTCEDDFPETMQSMILSLLADHGYVYVPADVLEEPYQTENKNMSDIKTWWMRFFDYL